MVNIDTALFGQLPYVFVAVAIAGTLYRWYWNRFSWSGLSSEFLENKTLFWGSFPWHYGIITILLGHILALVWPGLIFWWNGSPPRLYALEIFGLMLGILALIGLLILVVRRATNPRIRSVTSTMDVVLIVVLLVQVITGVFQATMYRWGSNWYAGAAVPWMWSLASFDPNVGFIAGLPILTKLHIFNGMLFIALFPFTRLVHVLAFINPLKYLGRPFQVVRWYDEQKPTTPGSRER